MYSKYIFTSLTRISHLADTSFKVVPLHRKEWANGDYTVTRVATRYNALKLELTNGRMMEAAQGDLVVGALGKRYATVEATGDWEATGEDHMMHLLTGAGLFGKMTSRATFLPNLIGVEYLGHVMVDGQKKNMRQFVPRIPSNTYSKPTVLIVGTSMSAGKTTVAKVVVRILKKAGLKVLGAKLTGAGRYRDILSMSDVGADHIYDFVDVGLPSTICPEKEYKEALKILLSLMNKTDTEVAVIEIGASPMEPYNGASAIAAIKDNIKCTVLCASDPYAVYGVMKAFGTRPHVVSGLATNTQAGVDLIEKLCDVRALNLIDHNTRRQLQVILEKTLDLPIVSFG